MKTVTIEVDPKFLPDGYEAVAYRPLQEGDYFIAEDMVIKASHMDARSGTPWLIIRPVRQWHQVTDANILDVLKNWKDYDFRVLGLIAWHDITISQASDTPPYAFVTRDGVCLGYWGTGLQGAGRNTIGIHRLQYSPKQ